MGFSFRVIKGTPTELFQPVPRYDVCKDVSEVCKDVFTVCIDVCGKFV